LKITFRLAFDAYGGGLGERTMQTRNVIDDISPERWLIETTSYASALVAMKIVCITRSNEERSIDIK
jgi:hypothetical protein